MSNWYRFGQFQLIIKKYHQTQNGQCRNDSLPLNKKWGSTCVYYLFWMLNILEAKHFMQLERIFLLNLIKMRTLNDLLCLTRTQVLVYVDDHYFCCCVCNPAVKLGRTKLHLLKVGSQVYQNLKLMLWGFGLVAITRASARSTELLTILHSFS